MKGPGAPPPGPWVTPLRGFRSLGASRRSQIFPTRCRGAAARGGREGPRWPGARELEHTPLSGRWLSARPGVGEALRALVSPRLCTATLSRCGANARL